MKGLFLLLGVLLFTLPLSAQPSFFPLSKKEAGGYFALSPVSSPKGILLVIPRPGQNPEGLLSDSLWGAAAAQQELVLVTISHPGLILLTPAFQRQLTAVLREACSRFKVEKDRIALGGLGEGGILALQFTEECWSSPMRYPYRPKALFCVQSPVDLSAWWQQAAADAGRKSSPELTAKARWVQQVLTREIGGAPDTLESVYLQKSPFTFSHRDLGKERYLLQTSIYLIYDADIQTQLEEGRTWSDLPAAQGAALISRLLQAGHENASIELHAREEGSPSGTGEPFDPSNSFYWVGASLGIQPDNE